MEHGGGGGVLYVEGVGRVSVRFYSVSSVSVERTVGTSGPMRIFKGREV